MEKKIDVLYLTPMWGMDIQMVKEFLKQLAAARIPTFVSEKRFMAEKGAAAVNNGYTYFPEILGKQQTKFDPKLVKIDESAN